MIIETGLLLVGAKTFALIPVIAGAALGAGAGAIAGISSGIAIGAVAGGAMGWGMHNQSEQAAGAAEDAAAANNKASMARYQYDTEMWKMKKKQLQASRDEAVQEILQQARNEGKVRAYQDAANADQYQYQLQIRNTQQAGNEAAFRRSEDIYWDTMDLNNISAKAAMDSNIRALEEVHTEASFDANEAYIEAIMAEGALRAKGASGRSAAKGVQATMADYGRQVAMLDASLIGSGRNTRAVLEEIIRDKSSADLSAYAAKMLDPGVLPMPIQPKLLPVPEFSLPRSLQEFDYGPQPVMGAMANPGAAGDMVRANNNLMMMNQVLSIGATLGGAAITAGGSDIELKENIEQVGISPSGLGVFEWNYIGETERYRGVMAQDLIAKQRNDAVYEMDNGYLGVDYSKVDVNMELV